MRRRRIETQEAVQLRQGQRFLTILGIQHSYAWRRTSPTLLMKQLRQLRLPGNRSATITEEHGIRTKLLVPNTADDTKAAAEPEALSERAHQASNNSTLGENAMSPEGNSAEISAAAEPRNRCLFSDSERGMSSLELVS